MIEHGPVIVHLIAPKDPKPKIKFKEFLVDKVPTPHRSKSKHSLKKMHSQPRLQIISADKTPQNISSESLCAQRKVTVNRKKQAAYLERKDFRY